MNDAQILTAFGMAPPKKRVNPLRDKVLRDPKRAIEDHWRKKLANQGQLSAYKPTAGERIESGLGGVLAKALGQQAAQRLAKRAMAPLNDLTPVGNVTGVDEGMADVRHGVTKGNLAQAALGMGLIGLNVLPGGGGSKRKLGDILRDEVGAIRAYHGGTAHSGEFNLDHAGSGLGYADEPAVWFTPDQFEANRYAWSVGGGPLTGKPVSGSYYGKAVYPANIDDTGFDDLPPMDYDPEEFARIIAEARKANKPGIVFRGVREDDRLSTPADQIAVLDPARIGSYFERGR